MSRHEAHTLRRSSIGILAAQELPLDETVERAIHAERCGIGTIWVPDEKFHRDPFVVLDAVAGETSEIRLATGVTEPYSRHPALIAMAMATLNERAPGRVVIGMGAGGSGFPPMHITRHDPSSALREATQTIRGLLAGEEVTTQGRVIEFTAGKLNFPTACLPIFLAGRGPRVLQTAAEVGDGVIAAPFASQATLQAPANRFATGTANRRDGIRPSFVARVDVAGSEDLDAARDAVRYYVALPLWSSYPNLDYIAPTGVELPREVHDLLATRSYDAIAKAAPKVPRELIDHFAVAGDYAEITRRLESIAQIVDGIIVNPVPTKDVSVADLITMIGEVFPD